MHHPVNNSSVTVTLKDSYPELYQSICNGHSNCDSSLECIRIIKTRHNIADFDYWSLEKFVKWLSELKEYWILVERKGVIGVRYYKRDFYYFPVFNRFHRRYVKKVIRKFEEVKYFAEDHSFVHIVLTVTRECSIHESIRLLRENWNNLRAFLKKRLGKNYPFITVIEPQQSGYPHLHILLFTSKFVIDQKELSWWCENRGLGKIVYIKRYWAKGGFRKKPIFYLIKYLSKQYRKDKWTVNELVFYACIWDLGAKTYTFSRHFTYKRRNKKFKGWRVKVLTREELIAVLWNNVKLCFYSYSYPLEYFKWSLRERFLWRYGYIDLQSRHSNPSLNVY